MDGALLPLLLLGCLTQEPGQSSAWRATGRVADEAGRPMAGVEIAAHCGIGSLKRTGVALSGEDGRYTLDFGPGFLTLRNRGVFIQAATITARKPGFFEANLNRQGDCCAADGDPTEPQLKPWRGRLDRVFRPGKPLEINFTLRPAGRVAGTLVDEQGQPLVGYSVGLTGADLPPSSSVLCATTTDGRGRFALPDLPTTYRFQFEVRMAHPKPPWDDTWAGAALRFDRPEAGDIRAWHGDRELRLRELVIRLEGPGVHGRSATRIAGNSGVLDLAGEPTERTATLLAAPTGTITLRSANPPDQ